MLLITLLSPLFSLTLWATSTVSIQESFPESLNWGLEPKITKEYDARFNELYEEEDRYFLKIDLGILTRDQFQNLKNHFGNKSEVPFSSLKNYQLSDFLPPSVQAVIDQSFNVATYNLDGIHNDPNIDKLLESDSGIDIWALQKNGLYNQINCWNTSFENINTILFNSKDYRLYLPGRWQAQDEIEEKTKIITVEEAQPWDLIVIRKKSAMDESASELMHTALVINSKIVFEKTDSTDNDPIRLSLLKDVLQKYQRLFEEDLVVEYRRALKPLGEIHPLEDPIVLNLIKKYEPKIQFDWIYGGCETGLGGGCDYFLGELIHTKVIVSKKTGRGLLQGPRRALDRFSTLGTF